MRFKLVAGVPSCPEEFPLERLGFALKDKKYLSLDTETTGLMPYHGDRVFALVLCDGENTYYLDLRQQTSLPVPVLDLFKRRDITWFLHNAKFDIHSLRCSFSCPPIQGVIHDTAVGARLEYNDHLSYSLDACVSRLGIGLAKSNAVEDYIKEHKLWEWETIPGKRVRRKKYFFDKVPQEIIFEYACIDGELTFTLGMHQESSIPKIDSLMSHMPDAPKLVAVRDTERDLILPLHVMERSGLKIDAEYCTNAIEFYRKKGEEAAAAFESRTGFEYKASPKLFESVFASEKSKWKYTEKGNPSFESDAISGFENPAAKNVLTIRNAKSRMDFFSSFLYFSDTSGFVHPSFNSGGTATGRFSSSEPNFQNLTNDEENQEEFPVRRAIIPPEPGYCIVSFDYKQQEYCLMLDYAGEMDLIEKVKAGADVHQATADLMGVSRKYAKTLNFMLLYGGGAQKLADALGVTLEQAKALKQKYFAQFTRIQGLIKQIIRTAELRGYVYNWAGRRYFCDNKDFSYTMPNRVIQGGGADIMKRAMVAIERDVLRNSKSTMVLTVHDELVFYIHKSELRLVPKIKKIMEEVYPHKHLPLTVNVEHSWYSLADLVPGEPEFHSDPQKAQNDLDFLSTYFGRRVGWPRDKLYLTVV